MTAPVAVARGWTMPVGASVSTTIGVIPSLAQAATSAVCSAALNSLKVIPPVSTPRGFGIGIRLHHRSRGRNFAEERRPRSAGAYCGTGGSETRQPKLFAALRFNVWERNRSDARVRRLPYVRQTATTHEADRALR